MQQQLRPLNVPEKSIAQTRARMRAFYQTRYVGNHKRTKISEINHAEVRFQRRERVVGDLRTGRGNSRDESRLARVWETCQTNIGKQLQLELQFALFATAAALVITRRTIRRAGEVSVAKATAAATRSEPTITIAVQVRSEEHTSELQSP